MKDDQYARMRVTTILPEAHPDDVAADVGNTGISDRHRVYFERRLSEERLAAASAPDPVAKLAHLSFVQLYEDHLGAAIRPPAI